MLLQQLEKTSNKKHVPCVKYKKRKYFAGGRTVVLKDQVKHFHVCNNQTVCSVFIMMLPEFVASSFETEAG